MIGSEAITATIWSYAPTCFVAFALRMALGWRGGRCAVLLLSAIIASALWAASEVTVAIVPSVVATTVANLLDTARYALWFGFLYGLVGTTSQPIPATGVARLLPPWWLVVAVAAGIGGSVVQPDWAAVEALFGVRAGGIAYAVHVALAVIGLVLVERLLRSTAAHARWSVKPLCLGLTGLFGFDLFFYSDAMLFGRLDPDIWVARGIAHALVLPFVGIAAARNPPITPSMPSSTIITAAHRSTRRLVLLAVAAAVFFCGTSVGSWATRCKSSSCLRRRCFLHLRCFPAPSDPGSRSS